MKTLGLNNLKAVLLDFDGVVGKTIEDHYRTWNQVFSRYDAKIGWDEFCLLEGQTLFAIAEQLCHGHGIDITLAHNLGSEKNQIYKDTAKLNLYADVVEAMVQFKGRGWKIGLVTGALRDRFEHFVDDGFKSQFDVIITADDVKFTKPNPEPFLKAAQKLNLSSSECVVIENAPLGITAAKAAGMYCFALTTTLKNEYLQEADRICTSLTHVIEVLRESD